MKFIDAPREHYAAFVLRPDASAPEGFTVVSVDLKDRIAIDEAVGAYRDTLVRQFASLRELSRGLRRSAENELAAKSEAIRGLVWGPLSTHLKGVTRVYLSPDARLHEVPFEAIATGENSDGLVTYLAESMEVVYQSGGRELARARLATPVQPSNVAVLLGDPLFDADETSRAAALAALPAVKSAKTTPQAPQSTVAEPALADRIAGRLGGGGGSCAITWPWRPVPNTGEFVRQTELLLESSMQVAPPLTGAGASKRALRQTLESVPRPRVLQLATHGFFCTQAPEPMPTSRAVSGIPLGKDERVEPDPMLRSMLILAGADKKESEDNGLLTASEVMSIDLRGTEVVALTACHSGQGELQAGEGVAGLRMAFAVAGARSVLQSLWEVPEKESLEQTEGFYKGWLKQSKPRYEAFRSAQLDALGRARDTTGSGHPWLWAGFTFAGDPGDLPKGNPTTKPVQAP